MCHATKYYSPTFYFRVIIFMGDFTFILWICIFLVAISYEDSTLNAIYAAPFHDHVAMQ